MAFGMKYVIIDANKKRLYFMIRTLVCHAFSGNTFHLSLDLQLQGD